ncbi:hypothetical protein [Streptacidiphilus sp. MAP12-20]|uniref:hypothetical protein n=1 Tax=Streptacidiphilus sp. MAP12-20 TaxID=3156299 RepID=UPI0035143E5F
MAGESKNDRAVVATLLTALLPGQPKIAPINGDVSLRDATADNLILRVRKLMQFAKAIAAKEDRPLGGLVVHFDMDAPTDSRYTVVRTRVSDELRKQGPPHTALALAAEETEAWLLLFPSAFPRVHSSWSIPKQLVSRDHGRTRDPKEVLQRGLGKPVYREDDSPAVMRAALDLAAAPHNPTGTNRSYSDFLDDVTAWS